MDGLRTSRCPVAIASFEGLGAGFRSTRSTGTPQPSRQESPPYGGTNDCDTALVRPEQR